MLFKFYLKIESIYYWKYRFVVSLSSREQALSSAYVYNPMCVSCLPLSGVFDPSVSMWVVIFIRDDEG